MSREPCLAGDAASFRHVRLQVPVRVCSEGLDRVAAGTVGGQQSLPQADRCRWDVVAGVVAFHPRGRGCSAEALGHC